MELVLPKLRRGVESVRMHLAFSKLLSSGNIGSRSSLRYLFCCLPVLNQPIESLQSLAPLRPMVSMPVHLKVSNDLVLKNFAGWSRRSLTLPLAAVSLLAAAVAEATRASCEPEFSPSTNKKTEILEEEAIKQYINELWRHLEDRMHGLSAGKPEGNAAQSLGEPSVSVTQGRMEIAADIPQNLNIEASVSHIRRLLRQSQANTNSWSNEGGIHYTASISETSSSGPRGTARRLHKSSSNQNETVEIEVMEPFDKRECVRFEFRGPATAETLQLVAGSLEEAFRPSSNRGGRSSPLGTLFDSLIRGDEFNQRGESEIEPFLGSLWELMHELQRHHLESGGMTGFHVPNFLM